MLIIEFLQWLNLFRGGLQPHMTNNNKEKTNPSGYDKDLFCKRVEEVMHLRKLDYDALATKFSEAGYNISPANLRVYITQRNLSLKVLLYLSKSLNVSMDYLVGNEVGNYLTLNEGFDHEFDGSRYAQYPGKYYVYFFPTRTNEPEELIESILNIDKDNGFFSTLEIPVTDGDSKIFNGHLILSKKTYTAFLNLIGKNGEIIQFTFNDPNTNQNKLRFCVSALISVSSGDAKRMPTLSRAIISEKRLTDAGHKFLDANLRLNSKYINIADNELQTILSDFLQQENIKDAAEICTRLKYAFKAKTYYSIEEQYFLNTFRSENGLTNLQTENLIADLRNHSMSAINCKTPRSIDARLYLLLKENGMFEEIKD